MTMSGDDESMSMSGDDESMTMSGDDESMIMSGDYESMTMSTDDESITISADDDSDYGTCSYDRNNEWLRTLQQIQTIHRAKKGRDTRVAYQVSPTSLLIEFHGLQSGKLNTSFTSSIGVLEGISRRMMVLRPAALMFAFILLLSRTDRCESTSALRTTSSL